MTPVTRSRLVILTGAVGGILFFLHLLGVLTGPEAWLMRRAVKPEVVLANAARSLRQAIGSPFRVSSILAENLSLRDERDRLLVQVAELLAAREEDDELRRLFAFKRQSGKTLVAAHVVARSPEAGTHALLIDRGSDDGLRLEMPVVTGEGVLIGKIFKLERATAQVLLLTDARSRIGASIQNAVKTQGIVQGKRGLSLEMRLIPQNEEIAVGDLVVTSGIEPLIPRGLAIGRVRSVETRERNPFKAAAIDSPVSFAKFSVVAVLTP